MSIFKQIALATFLAFGVFHSIPCATTSSADFFHKTAYVINADTDPCNEPAPTNFRVTDESSHSITVAWDAPLIPPAQYNIKAIEVVSGIQVVNQNIGGGLTTWTLTNLQAGTQYLIRLTPVCPDGQLSQYYVTSLGSTVIVELLTLEFKPSEGSPSCGMYVPTDYCEANPPSGNFVTFAIKNGESEKGRFFGVYQASPDCPITSIIVDPNDSDSPYQFSCNTSQNTPCAGEMIHIKYQNSLVAVLFINLHETGSKQLVTKSIVDSYEIIRLGSDSGESIGEGTCGSSGQEGRPVSTTQPSRQAPTSISTTPNPFTDQIDLTIPFAHPNEATEISLYNLQGRRVLLTRVPGNQPNVRISTENLSPGMYFLRAESGGIYQTAKVVKTH
jgi:hypothetical protein